MPVRGGEPNLGRVEAARRALVTQAVGAEVLRAVAGLLSPAGIAVMPLKGVWLQACAYPAAGERAVTDVDILVPEAEYGRALVLLSGAGWQPQAGNEAERAMRHPSWGLPIDVHRRLFTRGAFQLSGSALFARGTCDRSMFGAPVVLPDPRDVLAHLIGHLVKSRRSPFDPVALRDFQVLAARHALDHADCAAHLMAAGMGRAARHALSELARAEPAGFYGQLLRALPRDPLGDVLVRVAARVDPRSRFGALPGFLLDRSLAAGARALLLRVGDLPLERRSPTNLRTRGL